MNALHKLELLLQKKGSSWGTAEWASRVVQACAQYMADEGFEAKTSSSRNESHHLPRANYYANGRKGDVKVRVSLDTFGGLLTQVMLKTIHGGWSTSHSEREYGNDAGTIVRAINIALQTKHTAKKFDKESIVGNPFKDDEGIFISRSRHHDFKVISSRHIISRVYVERVVAFDERGICNESLVHDPSENLWFLLHGPLDIRWGKDKDENAKHGARK